MTTETKGISFAVDDVEPVLSRLETCKTHESISGILAYADMALTKDTLPELVSCSGYNSECIKRVYINSLLAAVHWAFAEHRPLSISPDMIWVTIVQGLANHVRNNSERLRHKLVEHQGRKELCVLVNDLLPGSPENDWQKHINMLGQEMENQIGKRFADLISDFSTTGDVEKTACTIAVLDVYEPYYQFSLMCVCGIPSITLEGSAADWFRLKEKAEVLREFELEAWHAKLMPILDQFVRASAGEVNRAFWQRIYKINEVYGESQISGWISQFFPYTLDYYTRSATIPNTMLDINLLAGLGDESPPDLEGDSFILCASDFPAGISSVPVHLVCQEDSQAKDYPMELLGGFVGVEQTENGALRPKLGWAVRKTREGTVRLGDLPSGVSLMPPLGNVQYQDAIYELRKSPFKFEMFALPPSLKSFYRECDGFAFDSPDAGHFRSLANVEKIYGPDNDPLRVEQLKRIGIVALNDDLSELPENSSKQQSWLRFFDFADGSYLAIDRIATEEGHNRVFHVSADGSEGELYACDFAAALRVLISNRGVSLAI